MNSAPVNGLPDLNFRHRLTLLYLDTMPHVPSPMVSNHKGLTEHSRLDSGPALSLANLRSIPARLENVAK
jgi:hypothetical protein